MNFEQIIFRIALFVSCYHYSYVIVAQMWPKCGPKVAQKWPEFEIFWPEINPSKFTVTRARPVPKLQARNPTRTMKKVARPSPNILGQIG